MTIVIYQQVTKELIYQNQSQQIILNTIRKSQTNISTATPDTTKYTINLSSYYREYNTIKYEQERKSYFM